MQKDFQTIICSQFVIAFAVARSGCAARNQAGHRLGRVLINAVAALSAFGGIADIGQTL
jgi:hypothetical protein